MKGSFSKKVLFSLIASAAVVTASSARAQEPDAATVATAESARRVMAMRDAMLQVQEARTDYAAKRYTDAVEHYRNALAVMPQSDETKSRITFIKDSLSDALIARAIDYRSVGRYEEAVSFLKEAVELSPKNERAKVELVHTQDSVRHNPALTPQHVANVEEVNRLLTLGYGELDLGNYDKATAAFEGVLQIDSYNTAARKGIENVQKRRSNYYATAHDSARAKALAEVDAMWEEPLPDSQPVPQLQEEESSELPYNVNDDAENQIVDVLRQMELPHVVFEDVSIMDVVDALRQQIANFEAKGIKASRNINVVTNFGTPDSAGYKEVMSRLVQLNLKNVNLYEILDYLARQVGVTYYISPMGVELSFSGKDFGPMEERVYTVSPHFFDGRDASSGDEDDYEDEDEDDFGSSSGVSIARISPMESLKAMGVSFPEGSYARYTASNRCLVVYNTAHNHKDIAELVNMPVDAEERAISLNITAVEVSEKDLEELGFEWLLNFHLRGDAFIGGGAPVVVDPKTGIPVHDSMQSPTGTNSMPSATEGLRSGIQYLSTSSIETLIESGSAMKYQHSVAQEAKAPGILSFRGVWNSGDLAVIMRGLSQRKATDLLYNPKLLFRPGTDQQVTFTNIREMFYPEEYMEPQVPESSWGNSSPVAAPSHPESFIRYGVTEEGIGLEGVGAIVKIHSAEVLSGGDYVTLGLTVVVNDFEGFINWGSPIYSAILKGDATEPTKLELTPNLVLKPVFKSRLEHTKITIAPGSVVVLGGLKESQMVKFEDKLPILGDLPFVGRFFRSEGEEKVRRALIMFAKVDLVDPSGKDPRTGNQPSLDTSNF